jgi:transcriptional regulator with XRE-family HTH domain
MADGAEGKRPAPVRVKGICQRCGEHPSLPKRYLCAGCVERKCAQCSTTEGLTRWGRLCKGCAGKARTAGRTDVHHWTPAEDEVIRAAYAEHYGKKALLVVERRLGLSRESIKSRAQTIGAARTAAKAPPWSPEELAALERVAHLGAAAAGRAMRKAGYARSATAIAVQRKRRRIQPDGMSMNALAELLGVDPKTVVRWRDKAMLRVVATGKICGGGAEVGHVSTGAIREFILRYSSQIDLARIERTGAKLWLVDLLAGGSGAGGATGMRGDLDAAPPDEDPDEATPTGDSPVRLVQAAVQEFSAACAQVRDEMGLSLAAHARRSGFTPGQAETIFVAATPPSLTSLAKLAAGLGKRLHITLTSEEP